MPTDLKSHEGVDKFQWNCGHDLPFIQTPWLKFLRLLETDKASIIKYVIDPDKKPDEAMH